MKLHDEWIISHYWEYKTVTEMVNDYNMIFGASVLRNVMSKYCCKLGLTRLNEHKWHNDWIVDNYYRYKCVSNLCEEYNREFNAKINRARFSRHCCEIGLNKRATNEEISFIAQNYPHLGLSECTKQFNKQFNKNKSPESIFSICKNHGIKYTNEMRSIKVSESVRKSDIGDISIHKKSGYKYIKYKNEPLKRDNWMLLHHKIYIDNFGDIPDGHIIIFLDNDKNNLSPSNLLAVPQNYIGMLNGNQLKSASKAITKTAVKWCELYSTYNTKNSRT